MEDHDRTWLITTNMALTTVNSELMFQMLLLPCFREQAQTSSDTHKCSWKKMLLFLKSLSSYVVDFILITTTNNSCGNFI